jgi:hypothetical protein
LGGGSPPPLPDLTLNTKYAKVVNVSQGHKKGRKDKHPK